MKDVKGGIKRGNQYLGDIYEASSKPPLTDSSTAHQGVEGEYGIQGGSSLPKPILLLTQEAVLFYHISHPLTDPTGKKFQDDTTDHYGSILGGKRRVTSLWK